MQVNLSILSASFRKMLGVIESRSAALNAAYKKVIGETVRKAYSDKHGSMYVQAMVDHTPYDQRPVVVSALRSFGLSIDKLEGKGRRYDVPEVCIKDRKKQQEMFNRIEAGNIPDIIGREPQAQAEPKKKELKGKAEERAQSALDRLLARLAETDPEARTILNDRLMTAREAPDVKAAYKSGMNAGIEKMRAELSGGIVTEDGTECVRLSAEEYDAVMATLTALRTGALKAA